MTTEQKPINEIVSRHEVTLEFLEKQLMLNGQIASDGILRLSEKFDNLDEKWDARFSNLELEHRKDAMELQSLKNKGAGVLASVGVLFTVTATFFSDFFSSIKHAIFG